MSTRTVTMTSRVKSRRVSSPSTTTTRIIRASRQCVVSTKTSRFFETHPPSSLLVTEKILKGAAPWGCRPDLFSLALLSPSLHGQVRISHSSNTKNLVHFCDHKHFLAAFTEKSAVIPFKCMQSSILHHHIRRPASDEYSECTGLSRY